MNILSNHRFEVMKELKEMQEILTNLQRIFNGSITQDEVKNNNIVFIIKIRK